MKPGFTATPRCRCLPCGVRSEGKTGQSDQFLFPGAVVFHRHNQCRFEPQPLDLFDIVQESAETGADLRFGTTTIVAWGIFGIQFGNPWTMLV